VVGLLIVTAVTLVPARAAERVIGLPGVAAFIDEMVERNGFERAGLDAAFGEAEVLPSVVEALARPAEARPWHEYRKIFLTPERVEGGVEFWREHAAALDRAQALHGVAPEVVVAIIGVETRYGRNTGSYRVLDTLSTIAFATERRADFFRRELEQFLLLTREEGVPPLAPRGSYAGAMGIPQFIASSFRRYAVDFDGDGRRDLWTNPTDAIGSVANYLKVHGWERGGTVTLRATPIAGDAAQLVEAASKPSLPVSRLRDQGVQIDGSPPTDALGYLFRLEQQDGYEYWLGLQNFYAITRYNHSNLYAMAVYQLAREIGAAYGRPGI
jgi:membrane-bound lytic murein transglycosylase B